MITVRYALHCPGGDVPMEHMIRFAAVSFDPPMYVDNVVGGGLLGLKVNPLRTWRWDYKPKK